MSRAVMFTGTVTDRFPRVSGDEPLREDVDQLARQFSPRERG